MFHHVRPVDSTVTHGRGIEDDDGPVRPTGGPRVEDGLSIARTPSTFYGEVVREILVELSAIIAGSSTGLLLYMLGADALSTVVVGADVAIAVQLVRLVRGYRRRSQCRRAIAFAVRSILDTHLDLTRIDPVGFGDYMTLRHLAAAADTRRLDLLVSFGGPAHTLGRVIQELTAWLEGIASEISGDVIQNAIDLFTNRRGLR